MRHPNNQIIWIFLILLTITLVYFLSPILTPFIIGTLLAYLTDPLVKRFEKWGWGHLLSVITVFSLLMLTLLLLILMISPLVERQIVAFVKVIPDMLEWIENTFIPWIKTSVNITPTTIKQSISSSLPQAKGILGTIVTSGYTIVEWIINLVLIPVVTFYLLRDWASVTETFKKIFPKQIRPKAMKLAAECDEILSAFFRGQLLVMISLCVIYGGGLTLIGLHIGFIIGVIGGLLSVVPYLGSAFVVVTACIASIIQFGTWNHLIWVAIIYCIGQIIETYILTPYFVGQRIGLHPVVVIFSIMAGGALFGFFGVLVALPAAALIKVIIRNLRADYDL